MTKNLSQEAIIWALFFLLSFLCEVSQWDYTHRCSLQNLLVLSYPIVIPLGLEVTTVFQQQALPRRPASDCFPHLLSPLSRRMGHPINPEHTVRVLLRFQCAQDRMWGVTVWRACPFTALTQGTAWGLRKCYSTYEDRKGQPQLEGSWVPCWIWATLECS